MANVNFKCIFQFLCLISYLISQTYSQIIHRSISKHNYQNKYEHSNNTLDSWISSILLQRQYLIEFFSSNQNELAIWISSVISASLVGLCGVLPVFVLPHLENDHKKLLNSSIFKCLVSFAAGTLLGDVFLHLLPETFNSSVLGNKEQTIGNSLWLIFGLMIFLTIEKIFPDDEVDDETEKTVKPDVNRKKLSKTQSTQSILKTIKTVGLLNLLANIIDNFTHGIAVAGSFQASIKFGVLTLIATLLHEIPHEIGDFVILLKSGLNYKQAAFAQAITATAGISGAIFALSFSSAEKAGNITSWILPFTSGGFLYIALVGILPDIINETNLNTSIKQILSLKLGILVIYLFSQLFD